MPTQLAIRLPDETLEGLDWLVVRCHFSNRTEAMRTAIEAMIKIERSRQIDEQYIEAYTRMPQTDEELADLAWQSSPDLDDDEDWSAWL
jgi:metal-responsive CopG/Arc/MetJ family transcriptional regulator